MADADEYSKQLKDKERNDDRIKGSNNKDIVNIKS